MLVFLRDIESLSNNTMTKTIIPVLLLIITLQFNYSCYAQCCAPGNPVSGSEHTGTLPKKTLRSITFFRHSSSDTYYFESEKAIQQGAEAGYDFLGEVLSYGINKRLALEAEFGYYLNKYQDSEVLDRFTTNGLNNSVVSAKYALIKIKGFELSLGSGIKIPISKKVFKDEYETPYPQEIQPCTGAFGYVGQLYLLKSMGIKWKTVLSSRYEVNGFNTEKYRFGNSLINSLFIGRSLTKDLSAVLQIRQEYRTSDFQDKTRYLATGGFIVFASPQISYSFPYHISVSTMFDIPVYRKYNGVQLSPKYAFGLSLLKDFTL
jgi:hypothetical protein